MRKFAGRALAALIVMAFGLVIAPGASADDTTVRAGDNGRTITISQGDKLAVRLGSCEGSCGYRWATTRRPNARILRRVSSRLSGQVRTFTYEGRSPGTTSLRLSYDPPGTPRAKRHFNLTVRVAAARCRPPADDDHRGFEAIGTSAQAALYRGFVRSGRAGAQAFVGCLRATGRETRIWEQPDNRTGTTEDALYPSVSGRYAAFVTRSVYQYFSPKPYYEVEVWDLSVGRRAWTADAGTSAPRAPFDEVVKFALTGQGDAAWIVKRAGGHDLWVRDGSGSVRRAAQGVEAGFLEVRGDTVAYRAGGRESTVVLNEAAAAPQAPPTTVVRARDNGEAVRLESGERLSIALGSCEASCGYRWRTVLRPRRSVLRTSRSRYDGQVRTFNYRAGKPGLTHVRLAYDPPGRARARRFFRVTVLVVRPRCRGPEGAAASGPASVLYNGSAGQGRDTESILFGCLGPVGRAFELFRSSSDRGFVIHGAERPAVNGRFAGYVETRQDTRTGERPTNTVTVKDLETGRLFWKVRARTLTESYPYDEVTALALTYLGDAAWIVRTRSRSELWVRSDGQTRMVDSGAIEPEVLTVDGHSVYYRKGGRPASYEVGRPSAGLHQLNESDNGRTVTVRKGDHVSVQLPTCEASCGYSWRFTRDPDANVLLHVAYELFGTSAGERRSFGFTTLSRGTTRLQLDYTPPGQGRQAERKFELRVVVR